MISNTHTPKLSDDVINQIKDFPKPEKYAVEFPFYNALTEEQKSLVDELIPNEELRERYKKHGLCNECSQPNTSFNWCQSCNSKRFQQEFNKWTSGNKEIDKFIQKFQLDATCSQEVLEWIPYEKFEDIEYLAKGGFGTVYKAKRKGEDVVLKCLNDSRGLTTDFLQEVCS